MKHRDQYPPESQRSPEGIVDAIIGARGNQEKFIQALGGLRRQVWADDWRFAERIVRVVQTRGEQGVVNALERNALIGHFVDGAAEARAQLYPRFEEIGGEMDRIERECTGTEGGLLSFDDAPQSYLDLEQEYRAMLARVTPDWLEELDEPELARLAREQPAAFEHMIVAGHAMIGLGTDDVEAVLDIEAPPEADLTAALALVTVMKRTKKAADIFAEIVTGLWQSPDDIHAVATARFAKALWAAGHLDENERFFVLDSLAKPMALASGMADHSFMEIASRLGASQDHNSDIASSDIRKGLEDHLVRLKARWLDDVDDDMATELRADRSEYRRRCDEGGKALLGDFMDSNSPDMFAQ